MIYVGLDAHQRFYVLTLFDPSCATTRTLRVRGSTRQMIDRLVQATRGQPIAVCFEASCDYGQLYDQLCQVACRVVVAHPSHLALIYRSKRKNDRGDSEKLAKLLALDLVPAVHVPNLDVRSWRRMIQQRRSFVSQRTATKSQLRALLRTHAITPPKGLWTQKNRAWWHEQSWPTEIDRWQARQLLATLDHLEFQVKEATAQLNRIGARHPGVALLKTILGVGPRTAEALVAWIDRPERFARARQVGAYFGLVPCQDQSAGRNRLGHVTKDGPSVVRGLLVEAAWIAIRKDPAMRAAFDRLVGEDPDRKKIAIVAIARKLAVRSVAMLKRGEVYQPAAPPPATTTTAAA